MTPAIKKIIIILVIAAVGFFGYNYLGSKKTTSGTLIEQDSVNTSKMGAEVLTALNQLKTLKLDSDVFKDKAFISLRDFSKPLGAEPIGRVNPFSPIGLESGTTSVVKLVATSSKATTTTQKSGN